MKPDSWSKYGKWNSLQTALILRMKKRVNSLDLKNYLWKKQKKVI